MIDSTGIPFLHKSGMFFEYYVFEPLSNFTENDLYHIVQFIDATFVDEEKIPKDCARHFHGLIFQPQEDITVEEFVQVLTAMEFRVPNQEYLDTKVPDDLREHFTEELLFDPYDDFDLRLVIRFLTTIIHFRIVTEQFNKLPKKMQRQFIVYTRDGKYWRFGNRRPT